jgi:glucose/arabinose dehydrogenase
MNPTRGLRAAGLCAFGMLASCSTPELLTPALPGPEASKKAPAEFPRVPDPSAEAAWVPEGYRAEVFLSGLTYPTSIEFDGRGGVYVAESGYAYGDDAAPARILKVSEGGERKAVADQLNGPVTDLLWHQDRLYVSHRGKISALDEDGQIHDLVTGLPSLGDHHNNQMAAGPDGKIYFGQGSATNSGVVGIDNFFYLWLHLHPDVCDVPARDLELTGQDFLTINPLLLGSRAESKLAKTAPFQPFGRGTPKGSVAKAGDKPNGCIYRMNPDGTGLEVYAWGLRNPFGVMWGPDGTLYVADDGYDERGSRAVAGAPDVVFAVKEGGWYGFPDYAGGVPLTDPRFKPKDAPAPKLILKRHPPVERPLALRPPHSGVTKIDFSTRAAFGFEGQMFLGEFGDGLPVTGELGSGPAGSQVVRIDPRSGKAETFFRAKREALGPPDWELVATAGPKRPVDVRFGPKGDELYVVDFGAFTALKTSVPWPLPFEGTGTVWRIRKEGERRAAK